MDVGAPRFRQGASQHHARETAATGLARVAVSLSAITGLLITGLLTIFGASYAVVKRLLRS